MVQAQEALRERISKCLKAQRQRLVTVLSSLLAVADELGYIPEEAIEEIAAFTHSTINVVWGVASFYTNFQFVPPSSHIVEICWGPTCHVVGAQRVANAILDNSSTATDNSHLTNKSIDVRFNTCLGACSQAPAIAVDHCLIGRMTPENARKIMSDLSNKEDRHG